MSTHQEATSRSSSTWGIVGRETLCLFGYVALALWWTWPLALHWNTHIGGGHGPFSIGDNLQFAWNFDHVARAWAQNRSAFSDTNLFFPHRASLALHTMQWHHSALAFLAWKIAPGLSLATICNGLLVGTLCLNATATRLLCRRVLWRVGLLDERAAWLVGAAAALGPIAQARAAGHWNLLAWGYLPLLMLALLRLDEALADDETPRLKYLGRALLASAFLALAGWCDVQYVLFAALWGVAFFVLSRHPKRLRRAAWWSAAFVGGVLLLSPMLATMMGASKDAQRMAIAPQWALDVANLLSPSPWHPILAQFAFTDVRADGIEWVVAPGLALLLLGVLGWRFSPQAARPWAWSAIMLWILACGPGLYLARSPVPPLFGSAPVTSASKASTVEEDAWSHTIRMPFWWLRQSVGPLKSFRVPARFAIVALPCWGVCAALGLSHLLQQSAQKSSSNAVFALLGAAVLFECWHTPLPSFDARTPRWAEIIRDARGDSGVVPLPIAFNDWRLSWAMWGQTIHHKPLFCAYLSRAPRDLQDDAVRNSVLWRATSTWAQSNNPSEQLKLLYALPSPVQTARDLELWSRHGARFLLWQRQTSRPQDEARLRKLLLQSGRARLVCEDKSALLWDIAPNPDAPRPSAQSEASRGTLRANTR